MINGARRGRRPKSMRNESLTAPLLTNHVGDFVRLMAGGARRESRYCNLARRIKSFRRVRCG
jgi:hypothetical protein